MKNYNKYGNKKQQYISKKQALIEKNGKDNQPINPQLHIDLARQGMNLLQRFKFDWNNSKVVAEQIEQIAGSLISKQRESIEHRMMIELDLSKKMNHAAYQQEVHRIDDSIITSEAETKEQLKDYMFEHAIKIAEAKKTQIDRLQVMAENGRILSEDVESLNQLIDGFSDDLIYDLSERLRLLFKQYDDSYSATLKLASNKIFHN